jgi:hypothetical protein
VRRRFALLTAGLLLIHLSAAAAVGERWLLVFDTSSTMKKRLPAIEAAIKNIYTNSFVSNLHAGDSVGVWTFGQSVHMGEFPLTIWPSENPAATASNLVTFVRQQHYAGTTAFAGLQAAITRTRIIADSERLTIIIFCDGQGEITGTPYDDSINQTLKAHLAERKSSARPFVLLLRTQRGKFTGCTVNFPPVGLNLPPFPPLPEEIIKAPTNPPPATTVAPIPPPAAVPALIIVGSTVGTNLADVQKMAATNPPVPLAAKLVPPVSNPPPEVKSITVPDQAIAKSSAPISNSAEPKIISSAKIAPPTTITATTDALPASAPPETGSNKLLFAGGAALGLAAGLAIFLFARHRRPPRGSLITSSMNQPRPPDRRK